MATQVIDTCDLHGTPARKEYDFGTLRPQPHVTVYAGCNCALYEADLPDGYTRKLCASYSEAASYARFALAIWDAK